MTETIDPEQWPAVRADLLGLSQTMRGRMRSTADHLDFAIDLAEREYKRSQAGLLDLVLSLQPAEEGGYRVSATLDHAQLNALRALLPEGVRFREDL